jgi:hypothetical protein
MLNFSHQIVSAGKEVEKRADERTTEAPTTDALSDFTKPLLYANNSIRVTDGRIGFQVRSHHLMKTTART